MIDLNFAGELLQRMRAESDELFSSDRAGSRVLRRAAENRKIYERPFCSSSMCIPSCPTTRPWSIMPGNISGTATPRLVWIPLIPLRFEGLWKTCFPIRGGPKSG
jgi:hypothetical protein